MLRKKDLFNYVGVLKYLCIFACFLLFNKIENITLPYSTAVFFSFLFLGSNLILTPVFYLLSFLILGETGYIFSLLIVAVICPLIVFIYKKTNTKIRAEISVYTAVTLLGFIFIPSFTDLTIEKKLLTTLITSFLTLISYLSFNAVEKKGLKSKFNFEEIIFLSLLTSVMGLGISNLISPYAWKIISLFILLCSSFLMPFGFTTVFSVFFGLTFSVFYKNINYVSFYLVLGLTSEGMEKINRHLSGISVIIVEYVLNLVFKIYPFYGVADLIFSIIPAVIFSVIPTKFFGRLKDKFEFYREKAMARQTINRNRIMLSNRLYELSNVFTEMANAFSLFKKEKIDESSTKTAIKNQIATNLCSKCENNINCKKYTEKNSVALDRLIDIGFAKGRISLIDLPREITERCIKTSPLIFSINKLLSEYRAAVIEDANFSNGRDLLYSEAVGVSDILKGLALESGTLLKYQGKTEKILTDSLQKKGFNASEVLVFGENEHTTVSLILSMKEYSLDVLSSLISKVTGLNVTLFEKADISEEKTYLSFKKSADFDAVFGLSSEKKDGSIASGDTHSVTKIKDDSFLVALSDGMGSGVDANKISSVSLSLIESFYKAGLNSSLILQTVNKLLAVNTEDSFTALDVSIIDLKSGAVDFIKYGSPYGFIIGDKGIKIVEGSSLPLGILEELKPSVCHSDLCDGDTVLLLTDGVSDAFGSSDEVIEFLRKTPAFNPQSLTDKIIEKALNLSGGSKNDDMTALAVRIFKKENSA